MLGVRKNGFTISVLCALLLFCVHPVHGEPLGIGPQLGPERHEVLSSQNGRFVFGQISGSSKDQFMLDTQTGRVWRIAESGEVGQFLRAVPYKTADGEYSPVPEGPVKQELKVTKAR